MKKQQMQEVTDEQLTRLSATLREMFGGHYLLVLTRPNTSNLEVLSPYPVEFVGEQLAIFAARFAQAERLRQTDLSSNEN